MPKQQTPLSVVARIRYGEHDNLRDLLRGLGDEINNNVAKPRLDFQRTTTYFGRLVILDNDPHYAPLLLFESQFDGSLDDYLDSLVAASASTLDEIFGKCEGYPSLGGSDLRAFRKWIKAHSRPVATYYAAYKPLTLEMARANLKLREDIRAELDRQQAAGALAKMSPEQVRALIQKFVADNRLPVGSASMPFLNIGDKLMVHTPPPAASPVPKDRAWHQYLVLYGRMKMFGKLAQWFFNSFVPFVIKIVLAPWRWVLHKKEKEDAEAYVPPPPVQSLTLNKEFFNVENQLNKNQMTHVVEVKPGLFRRLTLRAVLFGIDKLSRYGLTAGRLADVATVHFARWIYIDDGKRLLFTSNFDGPWSAYLTDFVDRTSEYLTGIWTNTMNFPPTRDLLFEGAQDIDGFAWFLRINQLPTEVWYAAFRKETVISIVSTTQIAQQMKGKLEGDELTAWLRRF